jgi:gamma-glutamyl hercynylcysteine S-oxide synthase
MFKKPQYPEVEPVVLKPWHGLRPAYYILLLLLLFILLIFFLLCLLPGLVSSKAYVSFSTDLPVLGVYEDGKYLGNGYDSVLETTSGTHTYKYTYEGIVIGEETKEVKRHYFFTFFYNPVTAITPSLTYTDEVREKAVETAAEEVASRSLITEYTDEAVYSDMLYTFARTAEVMGIEDVRDIWLYSLLHVTSDEMYQDYLRAKAVYDENGITYETDESRKVEEYIISLYGSNDTSEIVKADETSEIKVKRDGSFSSYSAGTVTLGETTSPSYPDSDSLPRTLSYDSFSMGVNMITENEYAKFVEENPEWSADNRDNLIAEGLVDSNYLKNITLSSRSSRPIRYISWYAADAYCSWRSGKDGVEYSLPTEAEWTVAALSASEKDYVTSLVFVENNSDTPTGLMGQLWDMTTTVYIPLSRLVSTETVERLESLFPYDGVVVLGGSNVNSADEIEISTVGFSYRDTCSEFNGFRLVKHE